MKKRDTATKKKATDADDGDKPEKVKSDENEKMDAESDADKKKITKKSAIDDGNENAESKVLESGDGSTADIQADTGDDIQMDKTSDNEDDEAMKDDDKEKRKKFVRLFCVHCRIESATFKVRTTVKLIDLPMISNVVLSYRIITTIFIAAAIS